MLCDIFQVEAHLTMNIDVIFVKNVFNMSEIKSTHLTDHCLTTFNDTFYNWLMRKWMEVKNAVSSKL